MLSNYNRFSNNFNQSPLEATFNRFQNKLDTTDFKQSKKPEDLEGMKQVMDIKSVSTLTDPGSDHSAEEVRSNRSQHSQPRVSVESQTTDSGLQTEGSGTEPTQDQGKQDGTNGKEAVQNVAQGAPIHRFICITPRTRAGCEQIRRNVGNLPDISEDIPS